MARRWHALHRRRRRLEGRPRRYAVEVAERGAWSCDLGGPFADPWRSSGPAPRLDVDPVPLYSLRLVGLEPAPVRSDPAPHERSIADAAAISRPVSRQELGAAVERALEAIGRGRDRREALELLLDSAPAVRAAGAVDAAIEDMVRRAYDLAPPGRVALVVGAAAPRAERGPRERQAPRQTADGPGMEANP